MVQYTYIFMFVIFLFFVFYHFVVDCADQRVANVSNGKTVFSCTTHYEDCQYKTNWLSIQNKRWTVHHSLNVSLNGSAMVPSLISECHITKVYRSMIFDNSLLSCFSTADFRFIYGTPNLQKLSSNTLYIYWPSFFIIYLLLALRWLLFSM